MNFEKALAALIDRHLEDEGYHEIVTKLREAADYWETQERMALPRDR